MTPCPSCHRFLRAADATCPFCGQGRPQPFARALRTVGGAVTAMVLAACYGSPYKPDDTGLDTAPVDMDGDGFPAPGDCDDDDPAIPAAEVCDDAVDNDCDGKIDAEDDACAAR
ncbi:MAG: hypothetical protein ACK4YP_22845 [Myxococcota bacterium]